MKKARSFQFTFWIPAGLAIIVLSQFYTNCGGSLQIADPKASLTMNLSVDHPDTSSFRLPQSEIRLGNREYVASTLKDVFEPKTPDQAAELNRILNFEVRKQIGLFGGACNIYSSEGLSDCSWGDISQHHGYTQDIALPFAQGSTSSREGSRLRACERILELNWTVEAAVARIENAAVTTAPGPEKIRAAFELFYIGRVPDPNVELSLERLVGERWPSTRDAWKALFLALCASPGWQIL